MNVRIKGSSSADKDKPGERKAYSIDQLPPGGA
jgi:hypothetical protein